MKILFISGESRFYTRNSVILKGLKENDVDIIECTSTAKSYLFRYLISIYKYILNSNKDFDVIFIGFFGQPLVPLMKILSRKPIVLDAFLSAYDTMCFDRKKFRPNSICGKFFWVLDWLPCKLADIVILDTSEHIEFFVNTFSLDRYKFRRIFVGADDRTFYPQVNNNKTNMFNVFYYGTFHPLQGIEYIVQAAKILEFEESIKFCIVGKGVEYNKVMNLSRKLEIKNIEFIDWIPYVELPSKIATADICLGGHFSNIDKGKRVIAGKTFQFIAMKKSVIVGDNPANRELFENKKNALLVEHANPYSLANAIRELKEDFYLRSKIAEEGYRVFIEKCTPEIIGKTILENTLFFEEEKT